MMVTFKNNLNNSEKKSNLAKLLATENLDVQFRRAKTASFNMEDRILTIPIYKKTLTYYVPNYVPFQKDIFYGTI